MTATWRTFRDVSSACEFPANASALSPKGAADARARAGALGGFECTCRRARALCIRHRSSQERLTCGFGFANDIDSDAIAAPNNVQSSDVVNFLWDLEVRLSRRTFELYFFFPAKYSVAAFDAELTNFGQRIFCKVVYFDIS